MKKIEIKSINTCSNKEKRDKCYDTTLNVLMIATLGVAIVKGIDTLVTNLTEIEKSYIDTEDVETELY